MINYDFVREKAKQSQIDTITILREYWQLLFLEQLYKKSGSEALFFKGGTAIRFLYGSFRFSEDLDFVAQAQKRLIETIFLDVFDFFAKTGDADVEWKKERVFEKFAEESLRYRFLFRTPNSPQKTSIRIDISFREVPQTREQTVLTPFDYPITPYPLILHLSSEEILAEKIRALIVRGKPRDLFDLWFLQTKQVPINQKLLKVKLQLYPRFSFTIDKLKEAIIRYNEKELKTDLNQFLPEHYRMFYKTLKQKTLDLLGKAR